MFAFIFMLFIAVPIIEIAVLIKVGGILGFWITLLFVVLTAALGTLMLRAQSISTLQAVQARMGAGELPATQLIEGVILLVGGVFLLTPGFITDGFGFFCLIPLCRRWLANKVLSRTQTHLFSKKTTFSSTSTNKSSSQYNKQAPNSGVIEGEFNREE